MFHLAHYSEKGRKRFCFTPTYLPTHHVEQCFCRESVWSFVQLTPKCDFLCKLGPIQKERVWRGGQLICVSLRSLGDGGKNAEELIFPTPPNW
jgi:hypothetical protein